VDELGEHVELLTGFPFKSDSYTESGDSIRLVRGDNVVQGRLRWEGAKLWPSEKLDDLDRYLLQPGDVVLAMDRPWIEAGLKYAQIREADAPSLLVQRVARLRAKDELDQGFLYYVIGSSGFTDHVLAIQTGTAVPHISGRQICEFKFRLPPLEEQRSIAGVLGSLDDKIEQNRRTAGKLEELARAVFRAWFVDFAPVHAKASGATTYPGLPQQAFNALPNTFQDSPLGPIPKGWTPGSMGDIGKQKRESVSGDELSDEDAYIGLEHMPRRQIMLSEWESAAKVTSNKSRFNKGDILFGKLRPYFHKVGPAPVDGVCSTDIVVLHPKSPEWSAWLLMLVSSDEFVSHTDQTSAGTKMPRTKWKDMASYGIAIPPEELAKAFQSTVGPMIDWMQAAIHENKKLAELRDYLLPRLLSGTVRVRDAEAMTEGVVYG